MTTISAVVDVFSTAPRIAAALRFSLAAGRTYANHVTASSMSDHRSPSFLPPPPTQLRRTKGHRSAGAAGAAPAIGVVAYGCPGCDTWKQATSYCETAVGLVIAPVPVAV